MTSPKTIRVRCAECARDFGSIDALVQHTVAKHGAERPRAAIKTEPTTSAEVKPDWKRKCDVCGSLPTLPVTGMCGPCTFGEAETINGNW